jgi:hypothetical protein
VLFRLKNGPLDANAGTAVIASRIGVVNSFISITLSTVL